MTTQVAKCQNCESTDLRDHCKNKLCHWKRCVRCNYFGDLRRPHLRWRQAGNTKDYK